MELLDYLPEEKFDVVFSMAALYYIVPMELISKKIHQWVKPGGLFIAGTDCRTENTRCHQWPHMLSVNMDIRSIKEWESLFSQAFRLTNVSQIEIPNPDQDSPTLFTWGFVQ